MKKSCEKGVGKHPVSRQGSIGFSDTLSIVSFGTSQLYVDGSIKITKTKKGKCDSCLRYKTKLKGKFYDDMDAKSLSEWDKKTIDDSPALGKLVIILEALVDLWGDKVMQASFKVNSKWKIKEKGCCPKK